MSARCALFLALLLSFSWSCSRASSAARESAKPKVNAKSVARSLFLNEPFALTNASCRVTGAKTALVESGTLPYPKARVRPDVRALEVTLRCENTHGQALESQKALPDESVVLLELSSGKTLAPRPDNGAHNQLIFDLPDDLEPELPTRRRFDTSTGANVVPRERAIAGLALRTSTLTLSVQLRQRYQDAALDALVDHLAYALISNSALSALARDAEAEAALAQLATIFNDVRQRFQPARLELSELSAGTAETRTIALSLTRPRNHESAFEVARFALTLAQTAEGALRVASFDNREAARNALACDALKDDLQKSLTLFGSRADPRASTLPHETTPAKKKQTCNALGLLLPSACNEVESELLARALEVGARCGEPFSTKGEAREQSKAKKSALPGDFQFTLRRGRPSSGLDRNPRYVVSLFHGGQVVFHGKHWVESQERSDGRTDLALLAGLYEHLRALDFFARRGGEFDFEHCSPSDDKGDVMTVIAADKQRMVLNRDGCRGPFSEGELTEIRRQVERVSGLSAWTQKAATFGDQDAEQWAIAE